jgi:hypothetical protein
MNEAPSDDRAHATTGNLRKPELNGARQRSRGQFATQQPGAQPAKRLRAIGANAVLSRRRATVCG